MGDRVKWAYGVTTVPQRRENPLPRTLASLRAAGFDRPRLFVDGDDDGRGWAAEFGLPVTARGGDPVRTYGNWVLSLGELYCRHPGADRFAVFQDDFITYRGLREYLTRCPYPDRGYWNLYTFPSNQRLCPRDPATSAEATGWFRSNQLGKGAVALVFNRETVVRLLSHPHMVERPLDANRGWKAVDGGIVTALQKEGWTEYVHHPSLVQHTGLASTMRNKPHKQAVSWRGEGWDPNCLLPAGG